MVRNISFLQMHSCKTNTQFLYYNWYRHKKMSGFRLKTMFPSHQNFCKLDLLRWCAYMYSCIKTLAILYYRWVLYISGNFFLPFVVCVFVCKKLRFKCSVDVIVGDFTSWFTGNIGKIGLFIKVRASRLKWDSINWDSLCFLCA